MAGRVGARARRRGLLVALGLGIAIGFIGSAFGAPRTMVAASSVGPWTGGIDLYRAGVFSTQRTWLWCTAADVQIIRNIVTGEDDHSKASQQSYFDYMRAHDRYDLPLRDGVEAVGWTAGLRKFVDSRYTLYESRSFDAALTSAVTNLRRTNLPVAITVDHGNHAWIITGFTATADPAATSRFTVTSVSVTGPLWGLQDRTYGYDMKPDTRLTPKQLASFFTPWHYAAIKMAWEGRWVSIQPVPAHAAPAPVATAAPPSAAAQAPTTAPVALEDPRAEIQVAPGQLASPPAGPEDVGGEVTDPPGSLTVATAADPAGGSPGSEHGAWIVLGLLALGMLAGSAMLVGRRIR